MIRQPLPTGPAPSELTNGNGDASVNDNDVASDNEEMDTVSQHWSCCDSVCMCVCVCTLAADSLWVSCCNQVLLCKHNLMSILNPPH